MKMCVKCKFKPMWKTEECPKCGGEEFVESVAYGFMHGETSKTTNIGK